MKNSDADKLYGFLKRFHDGKDLEQLFETAQERQDSLSFIGTHIVQYASISGVQMVPCGVKSINRAQEVVNDRHHGNAAYISDINRISFKLYEPHLADDIVKGLEKSFEVCETGWQLSSRGGMGKFVYVAIEDRKGDKYVGEVILRMQEQYISEPVLKAKRRSYEIARKMEGGSNRQFIMPDNDRFNNEILPEFREYVSKVREKLPENFICEGIKSIGHDPKPDEVFFALVEQSTKIMDELTKVSSPAWQKLREKLKEEYLNHGADYRVRS